MEHLFLQVLNMSMTASWVILAVLVLRLLLMRAPKIWSYVLWAVVFFRLLCPFSLESVFSLVPVRAQSIPADIAYAQYPAIESGLTVVDRAINSSLPAAEPFASANPLQIYLAVGEALWLLGMTLLLLASGLSLWRLLKRLKPARAEGTGIYTVPGLTTPFVLGIVRPRIYLPEGLKEQEQAYILLHEQTHIKRRDHWVKLAAFVALCLHWFNPLVWLSFYLLSKDMEMSCDEQVLRQMGLGIKKAYSSSLLRLAVGRTAWHGTPLAFGESDVKSRIKNILRYQKPAFWLVVLAAGILVLAVVGLTTNPRREAQDLSFLNPHNLVDVVAEQAEIRVNPYLWDSYVYLSGPDTAKWLDDTHWHNLQTPPENLPQVTYSLEGLQGGEGISEIHLFAERPTLAAVLDAQESAYYTIDEQAYAQLEALVFQHAGRSGEQFMRISERIAVLLEEIESTPKTSSNPGDYIEAHQDAFDELLGYGDTALLYCFNCFENNGPLSDLRGWLLAEVCQALAGEAENTHFDTAIGQAWYESFKAQALLAKETVDLAEMEKHQPAGYLLLQYLASDKDDLLGSWSGVKDLRNDRIGGMLAEEAQAPETVANLQEISLPSYQYTGDDAIKQLVYQMVAKNHQPEQGFGIYAVQIIKSVEEGDYLKIFCIYYTGTYRLYGQNVLEEGAAIVPAALTYQRTAEGSFVLTQQQEADDGSQFTPSIEKYCTLPVSGQTIQGLAGQIMQDYADHTTLLELVRTNLCEHLLQYGQTGVNLVTSYDDSVTALT